MRGNSPAIKAFHHTRTIRNDSFLAGLGRLSGSAVSGRWRRRTLHAGLLLRRCIALLDGLPSVVYPAGIAGSLNGTNYPDQRERCNRQYQADQQNVPDCTWRRTRAGFILFEMYFLVAAIHPAPSKLRVLKPEVIAQRMPTTDVPPAIPRLGQQPAMWRWKHRHRPGNDCSTKPQPRRSRALSVSLDASAIEKGWASFMPSSSSHDIGTATGAPSRARAE